MDNFKKKDEQTSDDIIAAEAKIIKSNIRELSCDKSNYSIIDKMGDLKYVKNWVSAILLNFFKHLISLELKQVSMGECIA